MMVNVTTTFSKDWNSVGIAVDVINGKTVGIKAAAINTTAIKAVMIEFMVLSIISAMNK